MIITNLSDVGSFFKLEGNQNHQKACIFMVPYHQSATRKIWTLHINTLYSKKQDEPVKQTFLVNHYSYRVQGQSCRLSISSFL